MSLEALFFFRIVQYLCLKFSSLFTLLTYLIPSVFFFILIFLFFSQNVSWRIPIGIHIELPRHFNAHREKRRKYVCICKKQTKKRLTCICKRFYRKLYWAKLRHIYSWSKIIPWKQFNHNIRQFHTGINCVSVKRKLFEKKNENSTKSVGLMFHAYD